MSLGLSLSLTQKQEIKQSLDLSQKIEMKIDLLGLLRGQQFRPTSVCGDCGRQLTNAEILKGFRRDVHDYTTKCPDCGKRLLAKLIIRDRFGSIEVGFLCPAQTVEALNMDYLTRLTPEEIRSRNAQAYQSAIFHYGSLKATFKLLGWDYDFDELKEMKETVVPFLGKYPDDVLANASGIDKAIIRAMRVTRKIKAFKPESS